MKKLVWIASILLVGGGVFGCQVMSGECWPVNEDGGGEGASAGVGGGPIIPGGVGGGDHGDVPAEAQATGDSPPPGCIGEESYKEVRCRKSDWGVECMIKCGEAGLACRSAIKHTHKPELAPGNLRKCKGTRKKEQCWYIFSDGTECVWTAQTKRTTCEM